MSLTERDLNSNAERLLFGVTNVYFGSNSGLQRPLLGCNSRGSKGSPHSHTPITRGLAIAGN